MTLSGGLYTDMHEQGSIIVTSKRKDHGTCEIDIEAVNGFAAPCDDASLFLDMHARGNHDFARAYEEEVLVEWKGKLSRAVKLK